MYSKVIQLYIYTYIAYTYQYIYFRFFYIIGYYKILNIVSCAIQEVLLFIYFIDSSIC